MLRTRSFVEFAILCWNIYLTVSDQTICSVYLVSGLHGVEDAALTASSSWDIEKGPNKGRLHLERFTWVAKSGNRQQYIQVQFPRKTVVDAILIQGRANWNSWVKTFYLLYSMDGITWTHVTSQSQKPRLFIGNSDRHTVVKSSLDQGVTAMYLRINPRSWHSVYVALRFDVSGCYKVQETNGRSSFYRLPTPHSSDLDQYLIFEKQSTTFPACSTLCHRGGKTCVSFTFDMNQKVCRGFTSVVAGQSAAFSTVTAHYFVTQEDKSLGFRPIPNESTLYKVNERSLDQAAANGLCIQYQSRLIRIDSESKMSYLQNVIAGNRILMKDHNQLFVSGMYESFQWRQYGDEAEVIGSALWSPGNPDPNQGHCVMLTQTGLASVDCTEEHFSICESVCSV